MLQALLGERFQLRLHRENTYLRVCLSAFFRIGGHHRDNPPRRRLKREHGRRDLEL